MSPDEMKRRFGLRVQALRRQRGLTQEELAEAIGKSTYTVSNIETGRLSTRIETALHLSEVLRVSLSELFDIEDAQPAVDREQRKAVEVLIRSIAHLPAEDIARLERLFQTALEFKPGTA